MSIKITLHQYISYIGYAWPFTRRKTCILSRVFISPSQINIIIQFAGAVGSSHEDRRIAHSKTVGAPITRPN